MNKILVTGAIGQIGTELTAALRKRFGDDNVIASDIRPPANVKTGSGNAGSFEILDVLDKKAVGEFVAKHEIGTVYHMAAILSATGEKNPQLCWHVNIDGLYNVLEVARERGGMKLFCPSSIAVFGSRTPRDKTPQDTILTPTTMYGVTKVSGELLCDYYFKRFNVDIRGLRYPGIISSETLPGGGTTDYAVDIYYKAVAEKKYTCFVGPQTMLPMMYMPDAIKATIDLMDADVKNLRYHSNYNLAAMSFSAAELAAEIRKHIPEFVVDYKPDFRQAIADSWPKSIDDSAARADWGWKPAFDLKAMTQDMLEKLKKRHGAGKLYS